MFLWYELRMWRVIVIMNIWIFVLWHQLGNHTKRVHNKSVYILIAYLFNSTWCSRRVRRHLLWQDSYLQNYGANKAEVAPYVLKEHYMASIWVKGSIGKSWNFTKIGFSLTQQYCLESSCLLHCWIKILGEAISPGNC